MRKHDSIMKSTPTFLQCFLVSFPLSCPFLPLLLSFHTYLSLCSFHLFITPSMSPPVLYYLHVSCSLTVQSTSFLPYLLVPFPTSSYFFCLIFLIDLLVSFPTLFCPSCPPLLYYHLVFLPVCSCSLLLLAFPNLSPFLLSPTHLFPLSFLLLLTCFLPYFILSIPASSTVLYHLLVSFATYSSPLALLLYLY